MYDPIHEPVETIQRAYGTEATLVLESETEMTEEFLERLPKLNERFSDGFGRLTQALHRRAPKRTRKKTYSDWEITVFTQTGPVTAKITGCTRRKIMKWKFDRLVRNHLAAEVEQELDAMVRHEQTLLEAADAYAELHPELPLPIRLDVDRLARGSTVAFFDGGDPAFETSENVLGLASA